LCADFIHNPIQTRRHFLRLAGVAAVCAIAGPKTLAMQTATKESPQADDKTRLLNLFLCGDVKSLESR